MNDAKAPAATPSTAVAVPAVPDYLKKMAASDVQNNAMDSMASAAMSIPRVSMRGKKFRFMEGGEEVFSCNDSVEVVIFGVEPDTQRFIKTYYDKQYGGANDSNPPTCASDDGVFPSGWVSNPQSATCAECPKNRFGSATSRQGKPSKACRDSKRLWVARYEDIKKGDERPVLYAVGVTVMSLKSLSEFGKSMKAANVPISAAIVKMIMDDDSEFPMISFQVVGYLDEAQGQAAIARGEKAEWKSNQPSRPAIAAPTGQPPSLNVSLPGQKTVETAPAGPENGTNKPANMEDVVKNW